MMMLPEQETSDICVTLQNITMVCGLCTRYVKKGMSSSLEITKLHTQTPILQINPNKLVVPQKM